MKNEEISFASNSEFIAASILWAYGIFMMLLTKLKKNKKTFGTFTLFFLANSMFAQNHENGVPKHKTHELDKLIAERFQMTYFTNNLLSSNIQLLDTAHFGIKFRASSNFITHKFEAYSSSHAIAVCPFKKVPIYFYAGQEVSGREKTLNYLRFGASSHFNEIPIINKTFVQLSLGLFYVPEIHNREPLECEINVLTRSLSLFNSNWHVFFEGQGIFSKEENTYLAEVGLGYKHASIVGGVFHFEKKNTFELGFRYAISER